MASIKISIIIPCYNAEKWIEQSVNSALRQTHEDIEIIVVDNESEDNSLGILKEKFGHNGKVVIDTAENIYKYSWEEPVCKALEYATGEYFTILGADDFISDTYIENVANILKKSKGKIQVLQSPIRGVDETGQRNMGDISHSYRSLKEFKKELFEKCPVTTPSVVYKTSLYKEGVVRWKSEDFLGTVDYDIYFNIADNDIFIYPYPKWLGYFYRWHKDQATWGMQQEPTDYDKKVKDYWREKWEI